MSYNNYPKAEWGNGLAILAKAGTKLNNIKEDTNEGDRLIINYSNQESEDGIWCFYQTTFAFTTYALSGEGPIAIANRTNKTIKALLATKPEYSTINFDIDWYTIVCQNYNYFNTIVDQDRDNPSSWSNSKLKKGDVINLIIPIKFFRKCKYEYESATELAESKGMPIDIGDSQPAYFYSKGTLSGKVTAGITLGLDTENAKAFVDVSLVGEVSTSFLIDNDDSTPYFGGVESSLKIKVNAKAEGKIGKLSAGAEANYFYNLKTEESKFDVSAYYNYGVKNSVSDNLSEKEDLKTKEGIDIRINKFKYDTDKGVTTISVNIKAYAKMSYVFRPHPAIKIHVDLEANASIDLVLVLPGNYEPEYNEETGTIDFGKTMDKVGLILPKNDTLYPSKNEPFIVLPRKDY